MLLRFITDEFLVTQNIFCQRWVRQLRYQRRMLEIEAERFCSKALEYPLGSTEREDHMATGCELFDWADNLAHADLNAA